jgi:hypothetical protein
MQAKSYSPKSFDSGIPAALFMAHRAETSSALTATGSSLRSVVDCVNKFHH